MNSTSYVRTVHQLEPVLPIAKECNGGLRHGRFAEHIEYHPGTGRYFPIVAAEQQDGCTQAAKHRQGCRSRIIPGYRDGCYFVIEQ